MLRLGRPPRALRPTIRARPRRRGRAVDRARSSPTARARVPASTATSHPARLRRVAAPEVQVPLHELGRGGTPALVVAPVLDARAPRICDRWRGVPRRRGRDSPRYISRKIHGLMSARRERPSRPRTRRARWASTRAGTADRRCPPPAREPPRPPPIALPSQPPGDSGASRVLPVHEDGLRAAVDRRSRQTRRSLRISSFHPSRIFTVTGHARDAPSSSSRRCAGRARAGVPAQRPCLCA